MGGVANIPPHAGGGFGTSVAVRDIVVFGLTLLAAIGGGDLDVRFESAAHPSSLMVQRRADDTRW